MLRSTIAVLMLSGTAWAQAQASKATDAPTKITVLDMEGDVIEGTTAAPDVEPVTVRHTALRDNLIRVREDFKDKALQSATAF